MKRSGLICLVLLASILCTLPAFAQQGTRWGGADGVDFERFKPALDLQGLVLTEGGQGELAGDFNIGFYLHYSRVPLELMGSDLQTGAGTMFSVVTNRLAGNLYGSIGITDWLAFGVDVPAVFMQDGDGVLDRGTGAPIWELHSFALGDIRVVPKVTMLRQRSHGMSMALSVPVSLPSGDEFAFSGAKENGITAAPTLAVSRTFAGGDLLLALNVGAWLRAKEEYVSLKTGHELFARLGIGYGFAPNWMAMLEASMGAKIDEMFENDDQTPLEGLLGIRWRGPGDVVFTLGGGMGFIKGWGTPDFRGFFGIALSPRERDKDGDGIEDAKDKCPDEPGPRENDGCPWGDADKDGLNDNEDKCPQEAGPAENKGCPWGDRDGDGVADNEDKCPAQPGPKENGGCPHGDADGDGVSDNVDKCPKQPGPKANGGCPYGDADGDGIADDKDKCPKEAGPAENGGCPFGDADGDGVKDADDKCPKDAGPPENDGCPWGDTDGDGVKDNLDKCPKEKGPKENNGCPWGDRDGDGIKDNEDKCPDKAGPPDSGQGKGCPRKFKLVKINREKKIIEIKQKIHFATARARIMPDSFGLMNQVAQAIRESTDIKKVRIEGHTDSRGSDAYNQKLSERRANAVKKYLLRKKVPADRLEAVGRGETKPVAPNSTAKGREANRRVEFIIVDQD
jgi:outer membrane protein OmpA-like peptidoglycan-associated protein